MKKTNILSLIALLVSMGLSPQILAGSRPIKPKLVLVLVYDQFRADYLTRFEKDFLPPISKKKVGGFRYLMEKGAYYPFAQYEVLQSMTCPGHATILTGSYPRQNGIPLNDWMDRKTKKFVYCAEDPEFGVSPKNLVGSTVGDELKLISPQSRVVGLALKDRSAIMLGGHAADGAFWFDKKEHRWTTSGYYPKPPTWLEAYNKPIMAQKDKKNKWVPQFTKHKFFHEDKNNTNEALSTPYGGRLTLDMAKKLIKEYKLGQRHETDILAVSFSAHDLAGHRYGATSPEMEEMTRSEDVDLSELLNDLNTSLIGGLNSVLVVLTADHGVAPSNAESQRAKLDNGSLNAEALVTKLNQFYVEKYALESGKALVLSGEHLNFYYDKELISQLKLKESEVFTQGQEFLLKEPGVQAVYVGKDVDKSKSSVLLMDQQFLKTYISEKNGDLILVPKPFWFQESPHTTTHMTGYSYDRFVPLILMGPSVKSGEYSKFVNVVDLAPTLGFILGTVPPALSEGKVLKDALQH